VSTPGFEPTRAIDVVRLIGAGMCFRSGTRDACDVLCTANDERDWFLADPGLADPTEPGVICELIALEHELPAGILPRHTWFRPSSFMRTNGNLFVVEQVEDFHPLDHGAEAVERLDGLLRSVVA
jgi:hypothetical protein